MADRLVPRDVAPPVQLLLRVARRLGQLRARASSTTSSTFASSSAARHGPVDEPPLRRLRGRNLLAHQHDLAGAAVADHDREPLRRAAGGHRAVLEADVTDERVVDHHGQVARHLQLVAAADRDPVHAGERRLADLAQAVVHVLERAEPLPVLLRVAEQVLAPRAQVGADAERAPVARDDDDADLVVPRRVLEARARARAASGSRTRSAPPAG